MVIIDLETKNLIDDVNEISPFHVFSERNSQVLDFFNYLGIAYIKRKMNFKFYDNKYQIIEEI